MTDERLPSIPPVRDVYSVRVLALAGVVGPLLFVLGFTVIGWLRPGYSPIREVVSALGVGPYAWLQNSLFGIFGCLLMLFAMGLYDHLRPLVQGRWLLVGCLLLLLGGVGMALSGVFTEDPRTHILHIICGFGLG